MIIGMLAFLLAAVLILLLIPIRYTVTLVRWRLTLSVSVICGLWRKEIELSPAGEEPSPQVEMTEEPPMDWMEEALAQAEEKAEVHERLPDAAEGQAESARAEKKGASLWREIMGSRSVSSMRQESSCRTAFQAGAAFVETLGQAIP